MSGAGRMEPLELTLTIEPQPAACMRSPINADGTSNFPKRRGVIPVQFDLMAAPSTTRTTTTAKMWSPLKVVGPQTFILFAVWTVPHEESYVLPLFQAHRLYQRAQAIDLRIGDTRGYQRSG